MTETFELERMNKKDVEKYVQNCEGHHTQQAVYSTFHDALTQVCYGCRKIRTSIGYKDAFEIKES